MAEIVLRDVQKDGNYYHLEAVLEQGKFTIQGHDMGRTVEEFWGEDEYEYWYEFDQGNTEHLFKAILAGMASDISDMSGDELLKSFQIWIGKKPDEAKLRTFCEETGIKYQFFSYS